MTLCRGFCSANNHDEMKPYSANDIPMVGSGSVALIGYPQGQGSCLMWTGERQSLEWCCVKALDGVVVLV